ncbi:hypothetical protein C2845_PM15G26070 [Panicum miliaceum]|uniref:Uncharacterized protein n=1 Tax=Panicum miliaceum TaxID=4540 RepID=A0A3L6Q669_PANMI|nr:hypothetical protein C2845_PM15G26070 [Panicum miliaceum]
MAALRPCPSGLAVGSFSTLPPRIVQPFGRRGRASLFNLKTSTGRTDHRHAIGAQKGADEEPFDLDPDSKKRGLEEQVKMFRAIFPKHYFELEKRIEATTFSLYFCMTATKGVKMASRVMETAALRLDKQDEISLCTTKQTLAMYVSSFVKLVKDVYDKKFNDESIFSLIGAFRGVAAVGRILLQDALANVNYVGYSSSNSSLVLDAENTSWHEFEQKMNNLEEKFRAVSKSPKAYEILRPTMTDAMKHTMFYILAVIGRYEMVLGYVPGT